MRETGTAIARCRTELANVHETIRATTLDAPALCAAVTEFAELVEDMAGLADELAASARAGLCARAATIGDVTTDLRTTARHLATAKLLLEPAVDDLCELAGSPHKVPA
jgi:hypothetical protein